MKYVIQNSEKKVIAFLQPPNYGYQIEWHKGAHTAGLFNKAGTEVDAFTFRWDLNTPTIRDFRDALDRYLEFGVPAHV